MNSCASHVLQHLMGAQTCESTYGPNYCKIPPRVPDTHLPVKCSWTLKRSCDNLEQFTFCKGPSAVFPSGTNCQPSTDYSNWSISYSFQRRHILTFSQLLPGLRFAAICLSESFSSFYSPSPLLFNFFKFSQHVGTQAFLPAENSKWCNLTNQGNTLTHKIC